MLLLFFWQMPLTIFRINKELRNCKIIADYHADKKWFSAGSPRCSVDISQNTMEKLMPDNRTKHISNNSGFDIDIPGNNWNYSPGIQADGSDVADAFVKKVAPEVPVYCCMSGCSNCVWIQYAAEMTEHFSNGNEHTRKLIQEIEDPSMRAFLLLELNQVKKSS